MELKTVKKRKIINNNTVLNLKRKKQRVELFVVTDANKNRSRTVHFFVRKLKYE